MMFIKWFKKIRALYFCAVAKEIFSKSFLNLDFFGSFFHQGKNEHIYFIQYKQLRAKKLKNTIKIL